MIHRLIKKIKHLNESESLDRFDISIVSTALLLEVIKADHQQTNEELEALRAHCSNAFSLSREEVELLIKEATDLSKSATSLWEHTDLVNEHLNNEDKYKLILNMWSIAYSDNELDRYEEHLIRKVSDLIYIPHTLFIKAKHEALKIRDQLG
jgi:uncharacterized tellurite resistance protein B-like protein